ncbi:MAG: right-handed parallel beta-helix repeat-containing protein [Chlorobia bacterium]|nr:right-handed parallel beta-helix repeat-containing protein [Fimbriimonadaceae bacterium]
MRGPTYHVSPRGDDSNVGTSALQPLATIGAALSSVRYSRQREGSDVVSVIKVHGGDYHLDEPIKLGPLDSHLRIESAGDGVPTFSSGIQIKNWSRSLVDGKEAWISDVSDLLEEVGEWRSLFVDGERRPRPRLPKAGHFWIESAPGSDPHPDRVQLFGSENQFVAAQGDFREWQNIRDIDVVVSHFWIDSRLPVASYNPGTRLVTTQRHAVFTLVDSWSGRYAKYHLENVGEALSEPGEWYLDKTNRTLTYMPNPGEHPSFTEVMVPRVCQLLRIDGELANPVQDVTVQGLAFECTDWTQPEGYGVFFDPYAPRVAWRKRDSFDHFRKQTPLADELEWGNTPQAALHVPGVVLLHQARNCTLYGCTIRHGGWYAISMYEGCQHNRVERCHLHDLGAGGIVADGSANEDLPELWTCNNHFLENSIHDTGHVWPSACGIVTANSARNCISYNEISDVTYTGISVGWVWGFGTSISRGNVIEGNHIHHLALRAGLSDLGGIYTLGVQPGTEVRGNYIHHIDSAVYGGQGIYLDEGSSLITVVENVVHDCSTHALCEHFGRGNVVESNVFAHCGSVPKGKADDDSVGSLMTFSRLEGAHRELDWPPSQTTVRRNTLLSSGTPMLLDEMCLLDDCHVVFESNRYWDKSSAAPQIVLSQPFARFRKDGDPKATRLSFNEWQSKGMDKEGELSDPGEIVVPAAVGPLGPVGAESQDGMCRKL